MHHKRKRPRSRRSGCKLCKPWKKNGCASKWWRTRRERRAKANEMDQIDEWQESYVVPHVVDTSRS